MFPSPFLLLDWRGEIRNLNHAARELLGELQGEVEGREFAEWVEQGADSLNAALAQLAGRRGVSHTCHLALRGLAPTRHVARLSCTGAVDGPGGILLELLSVEQEPSVPEGRLHERPLLQMVAESDSLMFWIVDIGHEFQYANRGWLRYTGWREARLDRYRWQEGVHPEDLFHAEEAFRQATQMGQPCVVEYRRRRFDGEYRWLRERAFPLRVNGVFTGYAGMADSVQELKDTAVQLRAGQRKYQAILETAAQGFVLFDPESGFIREANRFFADLVGHSRYQLLGKTLKEFVAPESLPVLEADLTQLAEAPHRSYEVMLLGRGKERRYAHIDRTNLLDDGGHIVGVFVFVTDIHPQKLAELELRKAAAVFETCGEAILVTDRENRIVAVNPAFCETTGYAAAEVMGRNPSMLRSERQDEEFYLRMWEALSETGRWQGEIWNRRKNGELFAEWLSIASIRNEAGEAVQYVAIASDITQRKLEQERLRIEAELDPLTELFNRRAILAALPGLLERSRREGGRAALLYLDLDRFKQVNDSLGHAAGDNLLRQASVRLKSVLRSSDRVARLGGDEFLAVLPAVRGEEDAAAVAEKLVELLAQPFSLDGVAAEVSASIGIALFPEHGESVVALMAQADRAMYAAKSAGRSRYALATAATAAAG